jgi:hypothetical protein
MRLNLLGSLNRVRSLLVLSAGSWVRGPGAQCIEKEIWGPSGHGGNPFGGLLQYWAGPRAWGFSSSSPNGNPVLFVLFYYLCALSCSLLINLPFLQLTKNA